MQTLKEAIGTLADAVSEEIENLKRTVLQEQDYKINSQMFRIEQMTQGLQRVENET
jgi:hypothetical protein